MSAPANAAPRAVMVYGLLGVIPFWSLPAASLFASQDLGLAGTIEVLYAALILSFLGGARWGLAVREPAPDPIVVGLAMIPTLAALAALIFLHGLMRPQLLVFAVLLALCCAWDISASGLPAWYGRVRTTLTLGAVAGLCVGALQAAP